MGRVRVPSMKPVTDIVLPEHTHTGPQGGGRGRLRATYRWTTGLDDTPACTRWPHARYAVVTELINELSTSWVKLDPTTPKYTKKRDGMKWKDEKSTCLVCCCHVYTRPNPYPQSS